MESITHPTAIALIYFLGMLVIGSAIQWTFLIKLKKHHPEQWQHAGTPTIISNGDLVKAWPTTKYLKQKLYKESNSSSGIKFCDLYRSPMIYGYFLTAISVPLFFASILLFGWPPAWS
ncbi:hypothetical protein [Alishewanella sp. HL-SH06]|uniref:hypothetical protein n=1 Tax=Alishewanella sp. HL-SH06 TaxID=3461144 RepID=UPI004041B9DA